MKIYGNKNALERLREYAAADRAPHSLLFLGDEGTGKKLLADYAAMLFYCNKDGAPCIKCRDCERIEEHIHPDVVYLDCGAIGVTELRDALRKSYGLPVEGKVRVFILTEFQKLRNDCQNAMLTYLEEPSDKTRFILTASSKNGILPTILSRAATVRTEPLTVGECEAALREMNAAEPRRLAELYGGNLGRALKSLFDENRALCLDAANSFIEALVNEQEYEALKTVRGLQQPKDDKRGPVRDFIAAAGNIIHKAELISCGAAEPTGGAAERLAARFPLFALDKLAAVAARFSDEADGSNFNFNILASAFTAEIFGAAEAEHGRYRKDEIYGGSNRSKI